MAKISTYGYKLTGIKAAAGDTKELGYGYYYGGNVQFFYDLDEQRIYSHLHGCGETTRYNCSEVIELGSITRPVTMKELADMIAFELTNALIGECVLKNHVSYDDLMPQLRNGKLNLVESHEYVTRALEAGVPLADIFA